MKTLWISPPEAINGATDMSYQFLDTNLSVKLQYFYKGEQKVIILQFYHVSGVLFVKNNLCNYYTELNNSSFESLVQIENSPWISSLKQNDIYQELDQYQHYVFANQNDGQIEVLSKGYKILLLQ